ncbi:MAG: glycoside hydrolase family 9 protein [Firmicutes bacterium]|nr:glycoside hydrolase family 9 protein [Bacillota bacterium]
MKYNFLLKRPVLMKATALMIVALSTVIGFLIVGLPKANAATPYYNFAEALQKSIYFYDAEKCGPGSAGRLEWRADCHVEDAQYPVSKLPATVSSYRSLMDPDGDGYVDLSGGFHDAGDHVRFGLPQGYAFSTLGWGYYEFKDAFTSIGEDAHMMEILKWFSDCYLKTIWRDSNGKVVAFCYQVGDGDIDHTYWGPPEFQLASLYPRPASFATASTPASDISAEVSAGLALMYLNYKNIDTTYANKCLDVAKAMYDFAKTYRGLGNSGGYYGSAYDEDELSWAATWLYVVTGDMQYINDITATDSNGMYTGYMKRIIKSTTNTWQNIWTHCWDVVWAGVFTKLASIFPNNTQFDYFSRWNFEYWSGGSVPHQDPTDTVYLALTPAGYGMINTWGSARYNTASQLCAMVYQKYHPARTDISGWAVGQMKYIMGNNPMGYSYIVGYGNAWAMHPHHRAAHGSTTNNMGVPADHKHTLWGALVGGPDASDVHKDLTTDYVYNEVAIDYNAGMVGALAAQYLLYGSGQQPVANFPPLEPAVDEFIVDGKVDQENAERTQVTLRIHNDSIHPPRFNTALGCRYYFNISEMLEAGQTINDVRIEIMYDQAKSQGYGTTKITGPVAVNAAQGIYYVQLDWDGMKFFGTMEYQFALVAAQDATYATHWNPSNDFSRQGLTGTYSTTNYVPVYSSGVKVFGQEPTIGPTPTGGRATPTPVSGIQVLYRCAETGATSNTIRPWFRIKNTGAAPLSLATVKIRYWYTPDGSQPETWSCDYASFGTANVTGAFGKLATPVTNADSYFEVGFTSSAGNVGAGATTSDIQMQFHKNDYTPYTQTNDYSFDPTILAMTQYTKVAGYINGNLVFGTEPGVVPTSTPTRTATPTPTQRVATATPTPTTRTATATPTRRATPTPTRRSATPSPTRRVTPTPTVRAVTPTPTRRLAATPAPTVPSGGYVVAYVIQSDWGAGATISVTVTNNTTTAVNGWTLAFTFPGNQMISNLWNGVYTQSGASVSVANTGFNPNIPAGGGSVNFGFNINYSGTNLKPTSFTLNGIPCQAQ